MPARPFNSDGAEPGRPRPNNEAGRARPNGKAGQARPNGKAGQAFGRVCQSIPVCQEKSGE